MKRKGVKLIMSEYADIVIGNLSLHWFRNYLDSKIVSLFFSKNDLIVVNNCNIDDDDKKLFLMNLQMETYNLEEHFQRLILQQSVTKLYFIL